MTRRKLFSMVPALALGAALGACGVRDPVGAVDAGGGGSSGTAATNTGGTVDVGGVGGTAGSQGCTNAKTSFFAACWGPATGEAGAGDESALEYFAPDLRVVGAVEPDPALCKDGFPTISFLGGHETAAFLAWELEDPSEGRWIIQFAVEGAVSEALAPGDIVDFIYMPSFEPNDGIPHGWVELERDGSPAIGFALDRLPDFGNGPDWTIEPAQASCPARDGDHCYVARAIRAGVNGDSSVVPQGESAEIGGVSVFNGYFMDNRECTTNPSTDEFLLGFHSAR